MQWSTDEVPAHERFAYWREVRSRNLFGVTAELAAADRADFRGRFSATAVGPATVVEIHASAYDVERTEADITRLPSDSLCIYQQLAGECRFVDGRGNDFVVRAGELANSHSDVAYQVRPSAEGFHLRVVKIPFAIWGATLGLDRHLPARRLAEERGLGALAAVSFRAFVVEAPHLEGAGATVALDALARLAFADRTRRPSDEDRGSEAVRIARLQAARRFVEAHLHEPGLSPEKAARALSISVRQLHLLFEPTGTSFARFVLGRRVDRARLELARGPGRTVADVAFACGFDSLSTFYRAFRAAHGIAPGDARDGTLVDGRG